MYLSQEMEDEINYQRKFSTLHKFTETNSKIRPHQASKPNDDIPYN